MTQPKTAFSQAMAELNPRQKQAVEQIDGPLMVLAGPGTGKTQVLTLRIAQILAKTDVKPSNILGLTYTDSAAITMRQRLASLIGSDAYRVELCTFHSFCAQVMREHPELFPVEPNTEPISTWEAYSLVSDLLDTLQLKKLRPINRPLLYVKDILSAISDLKTEGVDAARYQQLIQLEWARLPTQTTKADRVKFESDQAKNQELSLIYQHYQTELLQLGRHDFDDMITWVVQAFQTNSDLLIEYQERYQYLLVDEYQDTNTAQNLIVDKLAEFWGAQANLCVVGDPSQAIYRFQGASLENTLGFLQRYPAAQVIQLDRGYRCSQEIYNASAALLVHGGHEAISNLAPKVRKIVQVSTQPLKSVRGQIELVRAILAPTDTNETTQVIAQIKAQLAAGVEPDQLAILCRTNREARIWHESLVRSGVPAILSAGADILQDPLVAGLLKLCRLIVSWRVGDVSDLLEVMYLTWLNLPQLPIMKLARLAVKNRQSLIDTLDTIALDGQNANLSSLEVTALRQFVTQLETWGRQDLQLTLPEFLAQLMAEIKLLDFIRHQPDRWERLHALTTLFDYAKTFAHIRPVHLADFINHIQVLTDHNLNLTAGPLPQAYQAVAVMTAHSAKGKEWDSVWIVGLAEGSWGNRRSYDKITLPKNILRYSQLTVSEKEDDERRLLYVAMTRARTNLTLSYPQKVTRRSQLKDQLASQFLTELLAHQPPLLLDQTQPEISYQAVEAQLLPTPKPPSTDQKLFFKQILQNFALSATALDKYLRDPANFVWDVLLRFPKAKAPVMAYGSAIHAGLETLYRRVISEHRYADLADVLQVYTERLRAEVLTPEEFTRRLAVGQTALRHYHNFLTNQLPAVVEVERFFGSGFSRPLLSNIRLSGRIDRIDLISATDQTAQVLDYKTGQVKSVNEILGQTGTSEYSARELALPDSIRGQYKRQLVFYKLLCELDPTCPYRIETGSFIFLKPCETGKPSVERQLVLSDQDKDDLKKLIQTVMAEINSLAFLTYLPEIESS